MKQLIITPPSSLQATITLPSSKSICNRALIINALAHGTCTPDNLSDCDDTRVLIRALDALPPTIDIMAAGTAMRFLTAYLAVTPGTHLITGTERMRQRPIRLLVDALRQLGADIEYAENEGFPPLRITGRHLSNDAISLPGNVSSQYISALLMIAPVLENGLRLTLTGDIVSRPYIDMTLQLMREYGVQAQWTAPDRLEVQRQEYRSKPYTIESDWSAASYWYEMAVLSDQATIRLPRLYPHSVQGDAQIAGLFARLGVITSFDSEGALLIKKERPGGTLEYDFTHQPDMAQTFVVTCALKDIPFRFTGLQSLKIKETDRIAALIAEMRKLGYVLHEAEDSILSWDGERTAPDPCPVIDTYEDHRMAMAFAPAAIVLGSLRIRHPEVVSKSYPRYWDDLEQAGFGLTEE